MPSYVHIIPTSFMGDENASDPPTSLSQLFLAADRDNRFDC